MEQNQNEISLPSVIYERALLELIESKLKRSSDEFDIIYGAGQCKGDGFSGELYRIQINDKKTKELKLNLVLKTPPKSLTRREMFSVEVYEREAIFYNSIYPVYKKFQEEKGIDIKKDGFYHVPLCYKTLTVAGHEGIFLKDLRPDGFALYDKKKLVKKEQVFLVMKTLGKMHAIFYSLKDQHPELVKKVYDLKEMFIAFSDKGKNPLDPWFENIKGEIRAVVTKVDNPQLTDKINEILKSSFTELMKKIFDRQKAETYATLCHGDCWNNNMLFRFDKNGNAEEIRLLDFQMMRYSAPVTDLVYYIFGATDKQLRDECYQQFMDVYYDELSSFMRRLGSNSDDLYPREIFENHLKEYGVFGFIMAMFIIPFVTNPEAPDFDKLALDLEKRNKTGELDNDTFNFAIAKNKQEYEDRMMGVCQDVYALGYI